MTTTTTFTLSSDAALEAELLAKAKLVVLKRIADDIEEAQDLLDLATAYAKLCEPACRWWSQPLTFSNYPSGYNP